jgi:phosphonate transport system permease protein
VATGERTWHKPTVFRRRELKWAVYALVAAFFAWSAWGLSIPLVRLLSGLERGVVFLGELWPPRASGAALDRIFVTLGESIAMAMVATVTGIVLSVPIAFMAAENLSPKPLYYLNRGFISLSRALNAIIVAILVVIYLYLRGRGGSDQLVLSVDGGNQ